MSEQKRIPFFEILNKYQPDNDIRSALSGAMVTSMSIVRETRSVELELETPSSLSSALLSRLEKELTQVYRMETVRIRAVCPESAFGAETLSMLEARLKEEFPPAAGLLAGAEWILGDDRLTLRLENGGVELLSAYAAFLEELVSPRIGRRLKVFFEESTERDELLRRTESIRSEAIKKGPAPVQLKKKTAEKKTVLYGRPEKSQPIPVRDLSLDSGTVTVRGEVFHVEHREIKKRNAWVVCFDLTDYTGSVRVSKFLPAADAKPMLDGIQAGIHLTVRGHVSFNRYDNDLVLEPVSISLADRTQRSDDAPEKRVELHAHTRMSSMDAVTDTGELVSTAARWGHRAVAITDHGVAQAYPDAMKAGKTTTSRYYTAWKPIT